MANKNRYKEVFLKGLPNSDYYKHYLVVSAETEQVLKDEVDKLYESMLEDFEEDCEEDTEENFLDFMSDDLFEYAQTFVPRELHWDYEEDEE